MLISREAIEAALLSAEFQFAKTMPDNPHHYTLRKKWTSDVPFEAVVQFIRDHGYAEKWGGRTYWYYRIGNHRYWTMGAALSATILINRAEVHE